MAHGVFGKCITRYICKVFKKFDVVHAHVTQQYYHIIDHSTICFSAFYGIRSLVYHGLHLG